MNYATQGNFLDNVRAIQHKYPILAWRQHGSGYNVLILHHFLRRSNAQRELEHSFDINLPEFTTMTEDEAVKVVELWLLVIGKEDLVKYYQNKFVPTEQKL